MSSTFSSQRADPPTTRFLVDLYKIAIDEYRYEVKLGWDRSQYFLVLNTAIISAGIAIVKIGNSGELTLLVCPLFLCGIFVANLGIASVRKGHAYYRRTVLKKTVIEEKLGLLHKDANGHDLSISTTSGMGDKFELLTAPQDFLSEGRLTKGTVVYNVVLVLRLLSLFNAFCFFFCLLSSGIIERITLFLIELSP